MTTRPIGVVVCKREHNVMSCDDKKLTFTVHIGAQVEVFSTAPGESATRWR
jgi:hypothetical protein